MNNTMQDYSGVVSYRSGLGEDYSTQHLIIIKISYTIKITSLKIKEKSIVTIN